MKAILLNRVLLVLAFVGLFVAGVLSLEAGLNLAVPCGAGSGCAIVAADPSSKLAGIPVAYLGALGYLILAGLAVMRTLIPVADWRKYVTVGYIVTTIGTVFSLYLQYKSFFVIHATCLWCLTSAATMVVTLIVYALLAQELENMPAPVETTVADEADATPVVARSGQRLDATLLWVLPAALTVGIVIMGSTMKDAGGLQGIKMSKVSYATLVPPGAHMMGPEHAPLTIVEFADLCCPACQRTSPQVKEYVHNHPGKIQLVYRHYPLSQIHPLANAAAAIAEIAADENRFWEYAMGVLSLQRQPNDIEELIQIAKSNGVSEDKVRTRLQDPNDPAYDRVSRDLKTVKELGITSTPTFFMMSGDKVLDTYGPTQVMEGLASAKYQDIINGHGG
ncbi:vitamin K epoxide reductase family protein [Fimbriimonas ginsengisoli]|uniref:Protein-disulfide isomerase n=1 Tax=Fimbriimonas ginsengisoli Gsoil 348 TaxID=661478 RepID=A0A068NVF3_FIMGI|nr:vitamin K epoxide reductase family protein [Fimbriimonas ginsengisoli]AIE87431.1 Protein-disulfide isomerase [Fimbriimonas ginsengisoli Gsoil 348]